MARDLIPMKQLAWLAGFLCSLAALRAQDSVAAGKPAVPLQKDERSVGAILEPLTPDRPGFSDGVNILSAGVLQLESGFSLSGRTERILMDRTFIGGSPLLRLGIGHRTELRFGGDGFRLSSHRAAGARERAGGASDFSLGAKFGLVPEKGLRPAFTLIPVLSLPVGHRVFTSAGIDPTVKLAWSKTLGESAAAGGNVSVSSLSDSGGRFTQRAVSFQLSRGVWRNWGGFWEAYLVAPSVRGGDRVWTFDTGLSYPIGRNAQFDVSVGQQIVPLARCWFVAAGLVVRRPLWLAGRK
ncbi:MAG: transporter [Candidatus Solibacter usitatus]|nr:transporter [Candidatus Solibacter usitatus]